MKAVGRNSEGLKGKQKGLKGARSCLDCMQVLYGHPRSNCVQLRRDDKLQEQEEEEEE